MGMQYKIAKTGTSIFEIFAAWRRTSPCINARKTARVFWPRFTFKYEITINWRHSWACTFVTYLISNKKRMIINGDVVLILLNIHTRQSEYSKKGRFFHSLEIIAQYNLWWFDEDLVNKAHEDTVNRSPGQTTGYQFDNNSYYHMWVWIYVYAAESYEIWACFIWKQNRKKIDKIKRKKLIKYGNFRNYDRWKPAETYAFEH